MECELEKEGTETPADERESIEPENHNGAAESATARQESAPAEAKETVVSEESGAEQSISGKNPGMESSPDDGGMKSSAAAQPEHGVQAAKEPKRYFLNLTAEARSLWHSMQILTRLLRITPEDIEGRAKRAVNHGEIPDVPKNAEELSVDEALLKRLTLSVLADRWGFVLPINMIVDRGSEALMTSGADMTLPTSEEPEVAPVRKINLPSRQVTEAKRAGKEKWRRDTMANISESVPAIPLFLKDGESYEEMVGEEGNLSPAGKNIQEWMDALTASIAEAKVDGNIKKEVVYETMRLLLSSDFPLTDFALTHLRWIAEDLGAIREIPEQEKERPSVLLPVHIDESTGRWISRKRYGVGPLGSPAITLSILATAKKVSDS